MTAESYSINTNQSIKPIQTIYLDAGNYSEIDLILILRKLHSLNLAKPTVVEAGTQQTKREIVAPVEPEEALETPIPEEQKQGLIKLFSDFLASIRST